MKLSAEGGQAKPVAANATGFNPWKFTIAIILAAGINNRINKKLPIMFKHRIGS